MKIHEILEIVFGKTAKTARNNAMEEKKEAEVDQAPPVPEDLPLLPLKDTAVYPLTVYPLVIG